MSCCDRVRVTAGPYRGKVGTIISDFDGHHFTVEFDNGNDWADFRPCDLEAYRG